MKKVSFIAMLALVPMCGAMAMQNKNTSKQMNPTYWSVTEIMSLPDNSPVVLRGKITKNMGNEVFLFEDSTGTIMLEIDETDWNGNTVTVDDIVTVYGNLDKNDDYIEVDVTSVQK
ncbi:MAG: NirD/YgiW/YdeI family stress tolerance protein [Alphaproteobacteria bacterium]|nr:NirD/YgiW/YdeI family stress tolerance protein [Alphaproteobacteria bacterium]